MRRAATIWLGRSYRRGPKAIDAYREAIAVEPLHWYAVLAAARIKKLRVEPPKPFENAVSPVSVEVPSEPLPLPETFEAYRSLGLDLDGIAWLKTHENALVAGRPRSQHIPLLTGLYRDARAYREALRGRTSAHGLSPKRPVRASLVVGCCIPHALAVYRR